MQITEMISAVDQEIARLQLARTLLAGESVLVRHGAMPAKAAEKAKRVLSPEAKERIASGQRKRWAEAKKAAKKTARQ
jgi:hypothetical protein